MSTIYTGQARIRKRKLVGHWIRALQHQEYSSEDRLRWVTVLPRELARIRKRKSVLKSSRSYTASPSVQPVSLFRTRTYVLYIYYMYVQLEASNESWLRWGLFQACLCHIIYIYIYICVIRSSLESVGTGGKKKWRCSIKIQIVSHVSLNMNIGVHTWGGKQ